MENLLKFIRNTSYGLTLLLFINPSIVATADQPSAQASAPTTSTATLNNTAHSLFCPFAKELTKEDLQWVVGGSWKSDNDSFVKEIGSFIGAQWSGVKYGTIICLYKGKDNIDFPVSIQQVHSALILEPKGGQWSGLTTNRKMCQSANVYDCPFSIKPPENITDIYKQIEYQGNVNKGTLYEPQY